MVTLVMVILTWSIPTRMIDCSQSKLNIIHFLSIYYLHIIIIYTLLSGPHFLCTMTCKLFFFSHYLNNIYLASLLSQCYPQYILIDTNLLISIPISQYWNRSHCKQYFWCQIVWLKETHPEASPCFHSMTSFVTCRTFFQISSFARLELC